MPEAHSFYFYNPARRGYLSRVLTNVLLVSGIALLFILLLLWLVPYLSKQPPLTGRESAGLIAAAVAPAFILSTLAGLYMCHTCIIEIKRDGSQLYVRAMEGYRQREYCFDMDEVEIDLGVAGGHGFIYELVFRRNGRASVRQYSGLRWSGKKLRKVYEALTA